MRRAWLVALALAAGCSTAPPRVGSPPPHVDDSEQEQKYREIYERWTRRTEVYELLDTKVFLFATEESPEFRSAKAQRMAEFQVLPTAELQKLQATEIDEGAREYTYFLGVHTNEPKWNDFDRPESIWRVALRTSAGEVTPISIERISRPNVNVRGIYLYLGDFWTGYKVHFPIAFPDGKPLITSSEREVVLRVASAVGHAELTFPAVPAGTAPGK